ncbi:hypothetical protein QEN19_004177 [Hanseniaspora menglaensis]
MAKIKFTEEILNQPLPEPKIKKGIVESDSDDEDAAPTADSFKHSEEAYETIQKEQDLFNKKQEKLAKKNKHLLQLRNKKQREESQKIEHKEDDIKKEITIDKLKAFEQQLIDMQQKTDRNRKLAVNDDNEEELEELDLDFLESVAETAKTAKPKKTIFKDEDNTNVSRTKYDSKRDDYIQQENVKETNKVSKLKLLREAKNKTQRIKSNGILIEKLKPATTSTGKQAMKNTKLSKLRSKLMK